MHFIIAFSSSAPDDRDIVEVLSRSGGMVDTVFREEHIDYFTAMSGSGQAFPALLAEALRTMRLAVCHAISHVVPRNRS